MQRNPVMRTKKLTITGLLTALSILIPMVMPKAPTPPPFSATLAAHAPLIIAMYISPMSALITSLGSAVGFLFSLGPIVSVRATTHVVFTVIGALMIRKRMNFRFVLMVTLILHSLTDTATIWIGVYIFGYSAMLQGATLTFSLIISFLGTAVHHVVDYIVAMAVTVPLARNFPQIITQPKNKRR